jgi:ketol-acid reductoisomerase
MRPSSLDPRSVEPALWNRPVGILGYGNQGRAQALNLRDAGLDVIVGARRGGSSAARARADGFDVVESLILGTRCAVVAVLTPDSSQVPAILDLRSGPQVEAVVFAHGYALRFDRPPIRADWDVLLVAPSGPGTALRRAEGAGGIPAFVAVHRDQSGRAWERARCYAVAAGCSADALFETTVETEAEIDLFGEQAVLCGGLAALVTAAWEALVAHGYDPDAAYLECVHQVGLTAEMITRFGVAGMRERVSEIALYGDLTRGQRIVGPQTRAALDEILREIRDGRFAGEWVEQARTGAPRNRAGLAASRRHPMEGAGARIRARISGDSSGRAGNPPAGGANGS